MDKLFTLLALQRQAQDALTLDALAHVITNETHKLTAYKQAVFWIAEGQRVILRSASGNAVLDEKSPYALSLKRFIQRHAFEEASDTVVARTFSAQDIVSENAQWEHGAGALLTFRTTRDGIIGGAWLERDKVFEQAELQILSELAASYAHALATLNLRLGSLFSFVRGRMRKAPLYIGAAALLCLLIPVRLSITAPAEIVAQNPVVISVPFDGMLEKILVNPGDTIETDQPVAEMDKITLTARVDTVRQELNVAQASLSRLRRESLSSPEKKIELKKLESDIAAQEIEFSYAQDMMKRSTIRSAHSGIAIFSDKNSLQGKPARMGEKIMLVAEPQESELLIRVPSDAMIAIKEDISARFFLNVSPLNGHTAHIRNIGYQASPDADGLLTYKIRATLDEDHNLMRIGWKGTAKIYGDKTVMGYALLRRPLANLRSFLGI